MKELIKGVETATRLMDGLFKGMGRKERWENSEKLIEKTKSGGGLSRKRPYRLRMEGFTE